MTDDYEPVTQKQFAFALEISLTVGEELPKERSKQAYHDFISENINEYNRIRRTLEFRRIFNE